MQSDLWKSFTKSIRALTKSPTKCKVVVQGLANHVGDILKNKIEKKKRNYQVISTKRIS